MHIPQTEVILRHGDAELARMTLPPGEYVIGRGAETDIRADTPLLSRQHALLTIRSTTTACSSKTSAAPTEPSSAIVRSR